MYIVWTFPDVPSFNTMFMLEAMTFKMAVVLDKSKDAASDLEVEAWTNVYHKDNPEGDWHPIRLDLINAHQHSESGTDAVIATYGNSVILTSDGKFSFTFRMREKASPNAQTQPVCGRKMGSRSVSFDVSAEEDSWIWAGGYADDGIVTVRPPFSDEWSKGPSYDHIIGPVHLGNFMAASVADELGFNAVLNLADTLDLVTSKFSKPVIYKKIPMRDGAIHQIPDNQIIEAVEWLQEQSKTCSKILVNCRAGIGRAGSVVVSYVFAQDITMSYEAAYDYVFSRRFVYPHKGLRDTLHKLYRRDFETESLFPPVRQT